MLSHNVQYGLFQDWKANKGNTKGRIILILFRSATLVRSNLILVVLFFWYLLFYRVFVEWMLGIELPWSLKAGSGLKLQHGQALVVNGQTVLGKNCGLKQSTTIGAKLKKDGTMSRCPIIGDNVDVGANVCIIGEVEIGDNVTIGAGAVVTKSIPPNSVAVGNPARVITQNC